ncbi:hypothetical protein HYFRA_00004810 [Hymenoscyphus fraxineus]|uniref:Integral membrane protein n=1 Tax=Hymenoscyphus fraxineus TaxID=746836 RepID=A0A9N9KNF5_9HELO|nr:hypothetical protein HYFRA_00004810 [Hymenoscyphus fraxineus]
MESPQGLELDYNSVMRSEAENKVTEEKTGTESTGQPANRNVRNQEAVKEASRDITIPPGHDAARTTEIPEKQKASQSTTMKSLLAVPTTEQTPSPTLESKKADISLNSQPWISTSLTFTLSKNKKNWKPQSSNALQNSLLAGVGFLELANAADFAANVWNEIPVPTFAAVLMGIGGVFAITISFFAFHDIILARRNYKVLIKERRILKTREESKERNTYLSVNFRELGTEIVDRIGMDAFLGFGAVMVGVGTLLAIGGANPRVHYASNLLSGYIGNTPVALFGIFNAFWSIFVVARAQRHRHHARKSLTSADEKEVLNLLRKRTRKVQSHATIMGSIGLISGGGSLATSENWEGYAVLIPCIILSAYCNWIWRKKVGYSRALCDPTSSPITDMEKEALMEEISINAALLKSCRGFKGISILENLVEEPESMASILEFLVRYDLFTSFCARVLKDVTLKKRVLEPTLEGQTEVVISPADFLLLGGKACFLALKDVADEVVKKGIKEKLMYRQRFLLEALGCLLVVERRMSKKQERNGTEKGK